MRTKIIVLNSDEIELEELNIMLADQRNDSMYLESVDINEEKTKLILKFKSI